MTPSNPPFRIETQVQTFDTASATRILKLIGPLTIQTLFDFQQTVRSETAQAIVLDLSQVPYMDSAGLGCIVSAYTSCQRDHRAFAITGICERIQTLFRVTHIDGLLPCFESVESAVAALKKL